MKKSTSALPEHPHLDRCPDCYSPLLEAVDDCCPSCGRRLSADHVVSDDRTPYATAGGYWRMVRWTVPAGSYRLGHLSRMRDSAASRRFLWISLLLLSVGAVLITAPGPGWHGIWDRGANYPEGYPEPDGRGWLLLGRSARPPGLAAGEPVLVRLWWNPRLWMTSTGLSLVSTLLLGRLLAAWVVARANRALRPDYRKDRRYAAAVHYSSAHVPILLAGAVFYGTAPLQALAEISHWELQWPLVLHRVPAYLIGALGLLLLWFWFLRMAHTTPPETAGPVIRYFSMWAPLTAVVVLGGGIAAHGYLVSQLVWHLRWHFQA